jgi:hypothetical protein
MQEEDILEHTDAKCQLCTLVVNLKINVLHKHTPRDIVEHTRTEILVNTLECQVSQGDANGEVLVVTVP